VTFSVAGFSAEEVRDRLWDLGVVVHFTGVASTRHDMTRRGLEEVVRASPHYFVSPAQVDLAVSAVASLV
jgi:cysteine desulfurase / selenocysteine lyase